MNRKSRLTGACPGAAFAWAVLVLCAVMSLSAVAGAALPTPGSQDVFAYEPVAAPVTSGSTAAEWKPVALGEAATGGEGLRISFGVGLFTNQVDLYLGVYSEVLGGEVFTISSTGVFYPISTEGLVPWVQGIFGNITGDPLGVDIPVSALPSGTYTFMLLAVPTGGDLHDTWYLWMTSLNVLEGVFLPGTQPGEVGIFENAGICKTCHGANFDSGPGNAPDGIKEGPYAGWKGSMMGNSARDPLFWALLAVENKTFEPKGVAIGDFCLRCHVPKGWLEGRSEPTDGSAFDVEDMNGVQCDVCHRMADPLSVEGKELVEPNVDFYRNAQFVVSDSTTKRGPYDDSISPSHQSARSDFHLRSEFCGTCHDITNPYYDNDVQIESTFTEWKYSAYGNETSVDYMTCQGCHMPKVTGQASILQTQLRDNIALHEFVGGNAWAPLAVKEFDTTLSDEDKAFLDETVVKATQQLTRAASLEATTNGGFLEVKVTNLTGHKLPTGYTEGRRMWINVKFYDGSDGLLAESGAYDAATGVLTSDSEIRVYEAKPGVMDVDGYADGPSFHFALNNYLFKDNRIPPKGFSKTAYESNGARIVGGGYSDGQNWDLVSYTIPEGAARVDVTLYYQTTSKEFVEFLRDENIDNKWDVNGAGAQIYDIWERTGRAAPVPMAEVSVTLP